MGIVFKQSALNTAITFLGFGIGGVNTLFLYTYILGDSNYGLTMVILSTAALLMPLMALGMHNTLMRFYEGYKNQQEQDDFLAYTLFLPLLPVGLIALSVLLFPDQLEGFLSRRNPEVGGYLWYIFLIGMAMAYFEIFYAYAKVQLKSVWGNALKEVFSRFGVFLLLLTYYLEYIDLNTFFGGLVGVYFLSMLLMKLYAYRIRMPKLRFKAPKNRRAIWTYTLLIVLGGSAAVILLEIDKFMLNQYIDLAKVAYYGVGIYIATVIVVPVRAMNQITFPLTAKALHEDDKSELKALYQKSSINLLAASGLLFLLIICSLDDLYALLPEDYSQGWYVVLIIGLMKVMDASLGNINSLLFYSKYYKGMLILGIVLAVLTIVLNILFIPQWGAIGAAWATFTAVLIYNGSKLFFVWQVFGLFPWRKSTLLLCFMILLIGFGFYWLPLGLEGVVAILVRSVLLGGVYLGLLYYFWFSADINQVINSRLKKG